MTGYTQKLALPEHVQIQYKLMPTKTRKKVFPSLGKSGAVCGLHTFAIYLNNDGRQGTDGAIDRPDTGEVTLLRKGLLRYRTWNSPLYLGIIDTEFVRVCVLPLQRATERKLQVSRRYF